MFTGRYMSFGEIDWDRDQAERNSPPPVSGMCSLCPAAQAVDSCSVWVLCKNWEICYSQTIPRATVNILRLQNLRLCYQGT